MTYEQRRTLHSSINTVFHSSTVHKELIRIRLLLENRVLFGVLNYSSNILILLSLSSTWSNCPLRIIVTFHRNTQSHFITIRKLNTLTVIGFSTRISMCNFIITHFNSQGGSQSGDISARAFSLSRFGEVPPLLSSILLCRTLSAFDWYNIPITCPIKVVVYGGAVVDQRHYMYF